VKAPSSAKWDTLEKAKNKLEAITKVAEMEFITISAVAAEISARLAYLCY
jgi:gas vesicle protein